MKKILFIFSVAILFLSACNTVIKEEKAESSNLVLNHSVREITDAEDQIKPDEIVTMEMEEAQESEPEFSNYAKDRLAEAVRTSDEVMLADLFCTINANYSQTEVDSARQLLDSWGEEFSAKLSTAIEAGEFKEEEKRRVFEFAHPTSKGEWMTLPILADRKCFRVHNLSLVVANNNAEKYLIDEQVSLNGKYKYELYSTIKDICSAGYLNRAHLVYCTLIVKDVETDEVLRRYESDSLGHFKNFSAPQKWYSDNELYIESGLGDACVGHEIAIAYNVITEEKRLLYSYQGECKPGILYEIKGRKILLNHEGDDLVVYTVLEDIKSVRDLYYDDSESSEAPIESKVKLIRRIEDAFEGHIINENGFSIVQGEDSLFYDVETDTLK